MTERSARLRIAVVSLIVVQIVFAFLLLWFTSYSIQKNNQAVCRVAIAFTIPVPDPPPNGPNKPGPTTAYGKLVQQYNMKQAQRSQAIQEALKSAINDYRCTK